MGDIIKNIGGIGAFIGPFFSWFVPFFVMYFLYMLAVILIENNEVAF